MASTATNKSVDAEGGTKCFYLLDMEEIASVEEFLVETSRDSLGSFWRATLSLFHDSLRDIGRLVSPFRPIRRKNGVDGSGATKGVEMGRNNFPR